MQGVPYCTSTVLNCMRAVTCTNGPNGATYSTNAALLYKNSLLSCENAVSQHWTNVVLYCTNAALHYTTSTVYFTKSVHCTVRTLHCIVRTWCCTIRTLCCTALVPAVPHPDGNPDIHTVLLLRCGPARTLLGRANTAPVNPALARARLPRWADVGRCRVSTRTRLATVLRMRLRRGRTRSRWARVLRARVAAARCGYRHDTAPAGVRPHAGLRRHVVRLGSKLHCRAQ